MAKNPPGFTLNSFTAPSFGTMGNKWYARVEYSDAKSIIKEKMVASAENFVAIGYYLKQIKEKEQYKEDGYDSIWSCAFSEFQLSQSAASRYINICKKFSVNGDSPMLDERYRSFSRSQLQEMLTIKDEKILEDIKPEMTTKEIRKRSIGADQDRDGSKETWKEAPRQQEKLSGQLTIEGEFREFLPKGNDDLERMDADPRKMGEHTATGQRMNEKEIQELEECAEKLIRIMDISLSGGNFNIQKWNSVIPLLETLIAKAEKYKRLLEEGKADF